MHATNLQALGVDQWRRWLDEGSRAEPVPRDRRLQSQGFVRPNRVVGGLPSGEPLGALLEGRERLPLQHFFLEGAVEAFLLALGLRVVGSPVPDRDAEFQEPNGEPGEARFAPIAPRRPMIHEHFRGEAVAGEDSPQRLLHRFGALVDAGNQTQE